MMKVNLKTNLKKILTLMLAVLCLVTLLSLMPEHQHISADASLSRGDNPQVLAQQQAYLLHHDDAVASSLRQF